MEKIKVLMVLGNTRRGGTQSFIMNMLCNIDRERFQIDLAVNTDFEGGWGPDIRALGSDIFISPVFKVYNLCFFQKWWKSFLEDHPYDIVHGHSTNSAGIYLRTAKRCGCKTIAHIHSTGYRGGFMERITKRYFSRLTKEQADYWFACSGKAAEFLFGADYQLYPRYYEIPNAIDVKRFEFDDTVRDRIRSALGVSEDTFLCGHVGTFSAPKNHSFLLEVFAEIRTRNPKAMLLMIGEGALKDAMIEKAKKLGLYDNIIFRQNLPNVNEYLMAMDLFIFPSLFEGFGTVSLEAQATGLNVIQSNAVPIDTYLSECVRVLPLSAPPKKWAERALAMPRRNRKLINLAICNTKYNVVHTISLITRLYNEMVKE